MTSVNETTNKSLGQHWLFDAPSLAAIVDSANISNDDVVLEIGPGLGPLTKLLTQQAKRVVAVEFDRALADELGSRVPADNLQVVSSDIQKFDLTTLPSGYKVVANVPYYLTSNIVRNLLTSPNSPKLAVLLVQKEVAQRLAAGPGEMSILAATAQFYAQVDLGILVGRDKFAPPPKVDSQVVILKIRPKPLFSNVVPKEFFRLIKAGFGNKRKTLRNSLSGGLNMPKEDIENWLKKAGISPDLRAEDLSLQDWHKLFVDMARS